MNDNLNYTEYNEERNTVPWTRIIIAIVCLIVVIVAIILIFRGCSKSSLRDDLIKAGKEYYEAFPSSLPGEVGECKTVPLSTLQEEEIVGNFKYRTCDTTMTYVNVCHLENGSYHYSATVSCKKEKTDYGSWKEGHIANLSDKSDVRFLFVGEAKEKGNKYYYPSDLTNSDEVIHYYSSIPSADYNLFEDESEGYKWYTESTNNTYWKNGSYSSTEPNGYPIKGSSKTETKLTITKPQTTSYRTIKDVTLYRYQTIAKPYQFICASKKGTGNIVSKTPCASLTNGYTEFVRMTYTCGDNKEVAQGTVCKDYTNWSKDKCSDSVADGIKCESSKGYEYTDTMWKWYKKDTTRKYYPSNAATPDKENTYFIEAPIEGVIKDAATKATVHKYYKLVNEEGTNTSNEFKKLHADYVTFEELISTFKNLGYPVTGLSDIKQIEEIRYQYKMQYRNVEE